MLMGQGNRPTDDKIVFEASHGSFLGRTSLLARAPAILREINCPCNTLHIPNGNFVQRWFNFFHYSMRSNDFFYMTPASQLFLRPRNAHNCSFQDAISFET